jgi:hypothetical protein
MVEETLEELETQAKEEEEECPPPGKSSPFKRFLEGLLFLPRLSTRFLIRPQIRAVTHFCHTQNKISSFDEPVMANLRCARNHFAGIRQEDCN